MLDRQLPAGVEWTPKELAVCGLISDTADDIETLKKLLAAELAKPEVMAHRCAELAGEIRQARAAVARMVASLDPEMTAVRNRPASSRSGCALAWGWSRWVGTRMRVPANLSCARIYSRRKARSARRWSPRCFRIALMRGGMRSMRCIRGWPHWLRP